MDNGAMENFFGRLKVEMFYGEKFESVKAFIDELIANVQEIKKSQEALNTSKTEFEKENYDKKIEEAKTKLSNSKNDLKNFEKLSQVTKLYESSGFKSLDDDLEKIAIMGKVFPVMFFIVAALVTITTITRMIEEDRTKLLC